MPPPDSDLPASDLPASDLDALVGSRICHDLISPLGAIGNGLELLAMSQPPSPEVELIGASLENAMARIRLFRLAFGAARADQRVPGREVAAILGGLGRGGRIRFDASLPPDMPRTEVRLLMLLLQCCETALAWGGTISLRTEGQGWRISARADRLREDTALWAALAEDRAPADPAAAEVHFALVAPARAATGRTLEIRRDASAIEISF